MTVHVPVMRTLDSAEALNQGCFCVTADTATLRERIAGSEGIARWPHLISDVPVFVPKAAFEAMLATVQAVEAAAESSAFRAEALGRADEIAQADHGPHGAFMGYDFHLDGNVPRLIEVNTNAGGASINALLLAAQRACCTEVAQQIETASPDFDRAVVDMFISEWRYQRGSGQPASVAIVDDRPEEQFLSPEFTLFAAMLESAGIRSVVADPGALRLEDGRLYVGPQPIDLVYNRLTDFMLAEAEHAVLRHAYERGAAVVTPNPHVYARLADKRNLVLFSDSAFLRDAGLSEDSIATLAQIPQTVHVTEANAEALWSSRRAWYFKPACGYGSKAVYRGDKLTRGVWSSIISGGYVAQALASPGLRLVEIDGERVARKVDIRLYTYDGKLLLAAARLYQGQATNFRTPGGGFAPVYLV